MKRLIAAGIILVLITTISITGITVIRKNSAEVERRMKEIHEMPVAENKKAEEFVKYWESKRELLAIFVNHKEIDEIGRIAALMASAERTGNKTDMLEAADEISFIMHGIEEDEQFSWFTIL